MVLFWLHEVPVSHHAFTDIFFFKFCKHNQSLLRCVLEKVLLGFVTMKLKISTWKMIQIFFSCLLILMMRLKTYSKMRKLHFSSLNMFFHWASIINHRNFFHTFRTNMSYFKKPVSLRTPTRSDYVWVLNYIKPNNSFSDHNLQPLPL
jgi:hypothetical protein